MNPATDVGWVVHDEVAYLAHLPHGPIVALGGTAGLIWSEAVSADDRQTVVERVRAQLSDPPEDLPARVDSFIDELIADGWLASEM